MKTNFQHTCRKDIVMESIRYKPTFIDGQPYIVRLLTSDEWDKMIDTVGADDSLLHYSKTASWTQDRRDDWSSRFIVRGGRQARTKDSYSATDCGPLVGYRPCLEPLNASTFKPDSSHFSHMKDGDILTFGSVRMGSYVFSVPKNKTSEGEIDSYSPRTNLPISIGDSDAGIDCNIQWIKAGKILVADRNVLKNISLQHLNMFGLVYGEPEKIFTVHPNIGYTQENLTLHAYEGVNMNIQDMLENACWKALHSNCNYKVSLSIDGGYKLSLNFVTVPEENDVAFICVDNNRAYVQEGPAWERCNYGKQENDNYSVKQNQSLTFNKPNIDELISRAVALSAQSKSIAEDLANSKNEIEKD